MPAIVFEPLALRIECRAGETVFAAARRQNVPVPTACVGRGTCGLCRVKVVTGEDLLSPLNPTEKRHLGNTYFITKLRLSCQLQVVDTARDDAVITLLLPDAAKNAKRLALSKP